MQLSIVKMALFYQPTTNITPASHHDSTYLSYAAIYRMHTDDPIDVVYAEAPNRNFLSMNDIAYRIVRKYNANAL